MIVPSWSVSGVLLPKVILQLSQFLRWDREDHYVLHRPVRVIRTSLRRRLPMKLRVPYIAIRYKSYRMKKIWPIYWLTKQVVLRDCYLSPVSYETLPVVAFRGGKLEKHCNLRDFSDTVFIIRVVLQFGLVNYHNGGLFVEIHRWTSVGLCLLFV